MKRRLIFLIGASGSGKDTVADYLCQQYHAHKVASYTTRLMRDGEQDGREHTFLHWGAVAHDPAEWLAHRGQHLFAQTYFYGHYYFASREQLMQHGTTVYVIDEKGLMSILQNGETMEWLEDNFRWECWRVDRPRPDGIDHERMLRDQERTPLPDEAYEHILHNIYGLDYLYSVVDAIMARN